MMKRILLRVGVCAFAWAALSAVPLVAAEPLPEADLIGFREHVLPLFKSHCFGCHGPDAQEADLGLHEIDPDLIRGEDFERWRILREQLAFGDMPPEGEARPDRDELEQALDWIRGELLKTQQPGVVADRKMLLPAYGNYVDHAALFREPAGVVIPSAPRAWRMRPEIYERFTSSIAERPQGLSQPFSTSPDGGIRDYAAPYFIDEPATDLLLRNAELVVTNQVTNNKYRELNAIVDPAERPSAEQVEKAIRTEFRLALHREPTEEELKRFLGLYEKQVDTSGHVIGGKATLMGVVMQPEALFRLELGSGPVDEHGRRRLAPQEIAAAVSYALDNRLDHGLLRAAEEGKLATREQVAAHVRRLLEEEDTPRIEQFFREYFGYPNARDVFKDNPERGVHDPGRLVNDLEYLIRGVLTRDREVLHELLTTNRYFVNYKIDSQDGKVEKAHHKGTWYQTVYGLPPDWKWTAEQPIELPPDEHAGVLTHPAWLVAWSGNFDNHPVQRGKWIRTHLLGGTVPDVPIGVDARIPEAEHKTLRQRLALATRKSECWRCHRKMDPLGLPFEQYDHYGHFRRRELEQPVDASGAVTRTGIAELEGEVADPIEMIHRLAKSEHVEQVFVRYAFRYFMGRNETLGDAKTLQEAHEAYRDSGGSFRAMVVSLLASDSFLYRK